MENFNIWWDALPAINKTYWIIASSSTLLFLVMFIISLLGGDHDVDSDIDVSDMDFSSFFLSFKSILAFLIGGSWVGLAALHQNWSTLAVILTTLGSGLLMMVLTTFLLLFFLKMQYNSIMTLDKAIGCNGEVCLSIPAGGKGKVEIVVNNSYKTYYAISEDKGEMKTHDKIEVAAILDDGTLVVKRQI